MEIKLISLGEIGTNCYLISSQNSAVVIDPGFKSEEVLDFLISNKDKEKLIILTHCHYDHISYANELSVATDAKIAIGEFDNHGLSSTAINLSSMFGQFLKPFNADILLKEGEVLKIGDIEFKIMHTPGHTSGGICLLTDNFLFSGDTLFYESIGRTDFPTGDFEILKNSVKRIYSLQGNLIVYPGHGPKTTVSHEKYNNPYIKG